MQFNIVNPLSRKGVCDPVVKGSNTNVVTSWIPSATNFTFIAACFGGHIKPSVACVGRSIPGAC